MRLNFHSLDSLLLLLYLEQQGAIDVWQNTSEGDCRANERVKFLVSSNSELQVTWGDTLDLQILGGVACELEDFGSQVF